MPLFVDFNKALKEIISYPVSGASVNKDMFLKMVKGEEPIDKELLEKDRLVDRYNSIYCECCDREFELVDLI
jgi:hypothetical protein